MSIFQNLKRIDRKSPKLVLFLSLLVLVSLACNFPIMAKQVGPPQPERNIETKVAETIIARGGGDGQDAVDQGAEGDDNAAPTATDTPEVTDTPTLTPTITETPTPEVAMVYTSENTNCRTGPGTYFPWLFTLDQGESAEAVARGSVGDYWYIKQPSQPSTICALWGKFATPSGPYEALPLWTPIPTPTPGLDFNVSFDKYIGGCFSWFTVQYRIDNTGGFTLESWRTTSTDHTGGSDPIENFQDKFYGFSDCTHYDTQKELTPGEAYFLNALFNHDPAGHDITVKVKICTEDGLGGECLIKNFRHTP